MSTEGHLATGASDPGASMCVCMGGGGHSLYIGMGRGMYGQKGSYFQSARKRGVLQCEKK